MILQEDIEVKIKALIDYELTKRIMIPSKKTVMRIDRNQIYDTVSEELGVHRVMVRRVARKLMVDYVFKVGVLQNNLNFQIKPKKSNTIIKEV